MKDWFEIVIQLLEVFLKLAVGKPLMDDKVYVGRLEETGLPTICEVDLGLVSFQIEIVELSSFSLSKALSEVASSHKDKSSIRVILDDLERLRAPFNEASENISIAWDMPAIKMPITKITIEISVRVKAFWYFFIKKVK
jgi:hypothetical protein